MTIQTHSVSISSGGRLLVSTDRFFFAENEITFLFGESGIGKSLICKALYGLCDSADLQISIDGRPYSEHLAGEWSQNARQWGFFVFQEPSSHLNPLMRISDQIRDGSLAASSDEPEVLSRLWQNAEPGEVNAILDVYPKPYRPSGGEKQRVLLAMAFKKIGLFHKRQIDVSLPPLFVFDEPTGSLDNEYRNCFLSFLMDKYAKRAFTALIITHDYSIISEIYRSYSAYKDRIRFMELSKAGAGEVRLNDFSAGRYFGWLEAKKAIDAAPAGKPVCTISPHLKIFGRSLCIYSDAGRTVSAPLVIRQGEIVYVKAPSGMGKTTLAKVIMGLYKADEFTMSLCGIDISAATEMKLWRQRIWGKLASMAFQHADEAMDLESTVNETFAGLSSRVKGDTSSIIKELFDPATVKSIINRKVKYLSGGQKQRLNLLRTLVLDASLTILDEPLSALDFDSIQKVLDLLETKRAAGGAFLMISHNEEIFESIIPPQNIFYLGERKNADA